MEVFVYPTRKNNLFHASVFLLGLGTDVRLDGVIITRIYI